MDEPKKNLKSTEKPTISKEEVERLRKSDKELQEIRTREAQNNLPADLEERELEISEPDPLPSGTPAPTTDEGFLCEECDNKVKKGQRYCEHCGAELDFD